VTQGATTRWWWVRHAPVVDAHLHRLSGQSDVDADLSDGPSLQTLAAHLPPNAVWMTSHLRRTVQTAEALWAAGAVPGKVRVERDFTEQNFGDWTGCCWADIGAADAFWEAPGTTRPPGEKGESFADVCARVAMRIKDLTKTFAGHDMVCVAHAGTIRAAVALALGLSPDQALGLAVAPTSLTRLDHVTDGSWCVVGLNRNFSESGTIF